jgi:hypothetical protein
VVSGDVDNMSITICGKCMLMAWQPRDRDTTVATLAVGLERVPNVAHATPHDEATTWKSRRVT